MIIDNWKPFRRNSAKWHKRMTRSLLSSTTISSWCNLNKRSPQNLWASYTIITIIITPTRLNCPPLQQSQKTRHRLLSSKTPGWSKTSQLSLPSCCRVCAKKVVKLVPKNNFIRVMAAALSHPWAVASSRRSLIRLPMLRIAAMRRRTRWTATTQWPRSVARRCAARRRPPTTWEVEDGWVPIKVWTRTIKIPLLK